MNNSFLNGIISSALAAQDAQYGISESSSEGSHFSGITEKDGYVGEMVKASLAILESQPTTDYSRKFGSKYTVIMESLYITVRNTPLDIAFESQSIDSVQEIIDFVEDYLGVSLDSAKIYYGSDSKMHIESDSEYGRVHAYIGIDAYQEVPANEILRLHV